MKGWVSASNVIEGERRNPLVGMIGYWIGGLLLFFTIINIHFAPWPGHWGMKFYGLPFIIDLFGSPSGQEIWGSKHNYSVQDWALLLLSACGFMAGWWGQRFRPQMHVPDAGNEESMRLAMESQEISISSTSSTINPTTASIVAGIVDEMAAQSEDAISGALGALSKGDFGEEAARVVAENPKVEGEISLPIEYVPIATPVPLPRAAKDEFDIGGIIEEPIDQNESESAQEPVERVVSGGMDVFSSGSKPGVVPEPILDEPIALPPTPPALPKLPEVAEVKEEVAEVKEEVAIPSLPSLPSLPGLPSLPSLGD